MKSVVVGSAEMLPLMAQGDNLVFLKRSKSVYKAGVVEIIPGCPGKNPGGCGDTSWATTVDVEHSIIASDNILDTCILGCLCPSRRCCERAIVVSSELESVFLRSERKGEKAE